MTSVNEKLGFGFYHSGVCVNGYEWAFGGNAQAREGEPGIFASRPRTVLPAFKFHEAITLGYLPQGVKESDVSAVLSELAPQWTARSYHLLSKNCNHFSEAFAMALTAKFGETVMSCVGGTFPTYVNRAARFADVVVPDAIYKSMMGSVPQPPAQASSSKASEPAHAPAPAPAAPVVPLATAGEMKSMSVREIKTMMWVNGVSWEGCIEKDDLIQAVERFRQAKT